MTDENFANRLKIAISGESTHSFSKRSGIADSTLRKYLNGSMPTLDKLLLISEASNVTLDWLIAGKEPMRANEKPKKPTNTIIAPITSIDGELFQEVLKLVRRIHQEEHINLPADAISTTTVQYYNALMALPAAPQDTEDLLLLLPWLEKQVRKDIRNAAAELGTGKHSA